MSVVAVALSSVHAERTCPSGVSTSSLRSVENSLLVVAVQINHAGVYEFLVDTGSQITTVDASLASELRIAAKGTTGLGGVATYERVSYGYLDHLQVGEHALVDTLTFIQDLEHLKKADSRIRGILGQNFLGHFDVMVDNQKRMMCLDKTNSLALAMKGDRIALAEPAGPQDDLPFTRPLVVGAQLSPFGPDSVLLRLDSASNVPLLYKMHPAVQGRVRGPMASLKRKIKGVEQVFVVLPPQDLKVGKHRFKDVSFVMPMNTVGEGPLTAREDGLLPTMAFQRVFISYSDRYVILDSW